MGGVEGLLLSLRLWHMLIGNSKTHSPEKTVDSQAKLAFQGEASEGKARRVAAKHFLNRVCRDRAKSRLRSKSKALTRHITLVG